MTDMTALEFGHFLAQLPGEVVHAQHHALEAAARIVEAEAKHEIGVYQSAAPPFAEWAELAESTKQERVALGFPEDEPLLRTGDLRDSITHHVNDTATEATVGSPSDIALYQELGTTSIPPRSFLGGALVRKADAVAEIIGQHVVSALEGRGGEVRIPIPLPEP